MSQTQGLTAGVWQNYSTRVDILTDLLTGILRSLQSQPMIAAMAGEDFVQAVNEGCTELERLREEVRPAIAAPVGSENGG